MSETKPGSRWSYAATPSPADSPSSTAPRSRRRTGGSCWDGRQHYYLDGSGLFELAGHPYVFDEAGAPVEVVRGEPELAVDEHEGGLRARLVLDVGSSLPEFQ